MMSVVPEAGGSGVSQAGLSSRTGSLVASNKGGSAEEKKGRRNYAGQKSARTAEARDLQRTKTILYKKKLEKRKGAHTPTHP